MSQAVEGWVVETWAHVRIVCSAASGRVASSDLVFFAIGLVFEPRWFKTRFVVPSLCPRSPIALPLVLVHSAPKPSVPTPAAVAPSPAVPSAARHGTPLALRTRFFGASELRRGPSRRLLERAHGLHEAQKDGGRDFHLPVEVGARNGPFPRPARRPRTWATPRCHHCLRGVGLVAP